MTIKAPKHEQSYPGRSEDCQNAIEGVLRQILDDAQHVGWSKAEAIVGAAELLKEFARSYRLDPAVAEDLERVIPASLGDINDRNRYRREGE